MILVKEEEGKYEKENISGVIFQTSDDVLTSESNLKSTYQRRIIKYIL